MDKQRLADYLQEIPKPVVPPPGEQEMLRVTLMNARRSSVFGFWLILLPGLLILVFFLNTLFHWDSGIVRWLAGGGSFLPLPLRALLVFIFLVGFPFIAVVLNLLAVTYYRYSPIRRELTITVRMKWPNLVIAIAGCALASFYILHLLADTLLNKR